MDFKTPAILFCLAGFAGAHGSDHGGGDGMAMPGIVWDSESHVKPLNSTELPPTYFNYGEHKFSIYSHIALMMFSWIVALPAGECTEEPYPRIFTGWVPRMGQLCMPGQPN